MIGGEGQRTSKFASPSLERLSFARVDQVERDPVETRPGQRKGFERFVGRVHAPQGFQTAVIQRLHAKRQPVDACCRVALEVLRLHAGRIGFERDFRLVVERPMPGDCF